MRVTEGGENVLPARLGIIIQGRLLLASVRNEPATVLPGVKVPISKNR